MKPSALLALHDVDLAAAETRRAVKELGAVGLCIITDPIKGRHVHIRYFDPLWAEAERLGVPICVHPTGGPTMDRFRDHPHHTVIGRALCNPLELAMAVACFCAGGVLERFPRLRVAFLEGNYSWLPWLLYRLDEGWEKFGAWEEIPLERRPSDYFLRQCFISVDVDEDLVGDVVRRIGDDTIVFSTDYPHHDCEFPNATKLLMASLAKAGVGEAATRKILWANAGRLYNLS